MVNGFTPLERLINVAPKRTSLRIVERLVRDGLMEPLVKT